MKRNTLTIVALGASLFSAACLVGQTANPASTAAAAAPAPKQQKMVKIATLPNAEANREFQHNVQVMQAQRQVVVQLNQAWEKEKDAKKKEELKKELDKRLAELNANNEKMQKAYGFSLTRNYTVEIEVAHVYLHVSDEEAAKIEAEQAKAAKDAKAKDAKATKKK